MHANAELNGKLTERKKKTNRSNISKYPLNFDFAAILIHVNNNNNDDSNNTSFEFSKSFHLFFTASELSIFAIMINRSTFE